MPKRKNGNAGLLFVYGTLKVDTGPNSLARIFDKARLSSKRAFVKGTLYNLGHFPGMTLNGDGSVHGELHRYSDWENIVKVIDHIEGFYGQDNQNNLYNRVRIFISTDGGTTLVTATAYEFAQSVVGYPKIENGIW